MHFLGFLEEARPVLFLQLFLAQYHIDTASRVVLPRVVNINFSIELQVDLVIYVLGRGVTAEGNGSRGKAELN